MCSGTWSRQTSTFNGHERRNDTRTSFLTWTQNSSAQPSHANHLWKCAPNQIITALFSPMAEVSLTMDLRLGWDFQSTKTCWAGLKACRSDEKLNPATSTGKLRKVISCICHFSHHTLSWKFNEGNHLCMISESADALIHNISHHSFNQTITPSLLPSFDQCSRVKRREMNSKSKYLWRERSLQ